MSFMFKSLVEYAKEYYKAKCGGNENKYILKVNEFIIIG